MRTEDVLAAVATGLWRWDNASGTVSLDGEAARLLGLPAEPVVLPEVAVRSRFHPVDWNEINGIVNLAVAEGTLAEARLRIMDVDGRVLRTVRSRSKPLERWSADGSLDYELIGTIQEIAEPQPGTTAVHTPITGDWRRSREAFLLDAGRALAEARSTAEVLRVAASLSMPGFNPDGLAVFGVAGDRLSVIGHHGHDAGDEGPFTDMLLETDYPAAEVVRTGRAIYLPSPEDYKRRFPATWPLAQRFDRVSWAFLPLIVAGRTMGAWMAAFKQPASFSPDERSVLTTVARMLAQALQRAGVAESERELTTGLQRSMMPQLGPEIPGMRIAARYVPTGGGLQVGGDWYDMIPLPSGRFALVIGDVQGHDVRAAGLMGQLRIAVRAYASEGHRPDAVLSRASRFLAGLCASQESAAEEDPDAQSPRFATCLYVECDPETGTLEVARAGHPDPAVRMTDGTVLMRPTAGGLPLGIVPDTDYPTTRFTLEPGETMMLCTDGLIETGGHDLDTGWARLRAVLEGDTHEAGGHEPGHLETLADLLVQAVHGPSSHHTTGPLADRREDDIAVVLLCREGAGCGCGAPSAHPVRPARRTMLTVAQAEPERISGARRQVRELLHDWADEEQVDSAVLMVSEMVTNVLMHTDGDALLVAEAVGELGERRLRVEVADSSDELPHKRHPGEMASSGRGVLLTEMLADAWGVDPRGEGKSIWFELYEQSKQPDA
ncbi:magnesium or manganese-dependent protein phosphatase [Streptomyces virginiae]|uniref:Magnesium or manganese-dependent protein phosphatase n=1 Tax=Streptomyces virginiae TaxID=1961 RepID=A0ABQ3NU19_STRVG|nr:MULTISPECIES: SpoIIE family protein phosphatase [Streptomyces]MBP2345355.1 serine phosphatase RsbU (regulator of sigma subunit) [Streptomyces virginiae]QNE26339.1 SpoIIE family protein phosphatase [Streptomyces sp. INR7]RST15326.1 GAF domain-containing protein [Streptomyces sp. WAC05950]GGQ42184.1 magnesium or manganese-dependent protein phosphatase [Streptomyces virginiae]GHI16278.1 magnesium or manganese-dependent protein phosphatase [Streptomyces virginiae]